MTAALGKLSTSLGLGSSDPVIQELEEIIDTKMPGTSQVLNEH